MKKQILNRLLLLFTILIPVMFTSCGPKDADIKANVEKAIQADPMASMGTLTVDVMNGVATIGGECKDGECKAKREEIAKGVKGVKSVVNNSTVMAPPPPPVQAPVTISADEPLSKNVTDAIKDHPGVEASVKDGVVTLTGEIKRADLPKLMQKLSALKPKKIENKLTIK
ncbi:BON domain-containing protein [Danxiaibacter flavus]|uniref:BON domain-containing protein n=1 Tax=Danxiaibacter flavus TaxID=3049108 RepID=A0ABV3ZGN4_9BACT|nr:BON domain-containing protein [Chitinophagaceae bacterium DXS]